MRRFLKTKTHELTVGQAWVYSLVAAFIALVPGLVISEKDEIADWCGNKVAAIREKVHRK